MKLEKELPNFKKSTFLITGGTGSFGNAMVERLLKENAAKIIIFSRDEKKQYDMRSKYCDSRLQFIIGDVRDVDSIERALGGVDYVFHAAALKQVPSCEFFPSEAVRTNVLGAQNLLLALGRSSVKSSIFLSTDKAVYPINVMGMTKALMEKSVIATAREQDSVSKYCRPHLNVTRYGNVMGSRGSIIPLFIEAAIRNRDIPITDERMTRFMMSLSESVELVLAAWAHKKSGEIFIYRADSAKVVDVARAIINITNSKSEIRNIGIRHGEKLHETLISSEEMKRVTNKGTYSIITLDGRGLDYGEYFDKGEQGKINIKPYDSETAKLLTVKQCEKRLIDTFGKNLDV